MVTPIWIFGGTEIEPPLPGSVALLVMLGNTDSVKKKVPIIRGRNTW